MRKKNIVTIGGGTGSFTLLMGLKNYPFNISSIVSMADDGGSTGRLRDELGVLPPGDVRQCLVALSEESKIVRKLFNYRFESGCLEGHSMGNLFLSALEKITGDFSSGVDEATKILKTKGQVIPVTRNNVNLYLKLSNKKILKGENQINHNFDIQKFGIERIYLSPRAVANKKALLAIKNADLIILGPGNHYCSIIPNLLVSGIPNAINKSKAKLVYILNLVNKKGHTQGFGLYDYVKSINIFLGRKRINYVLFNSKNPTRSLREKYLQKGEDLVTLGAIPSRNNFLVVQADLLSNKGCLYSKADAIASQRSLIRHDSDKLAEAVMYISEIKSYQKLIKKIF